MTQDSRGLWNSHQRYAQEYDKEGSHQQSGGLHVADGG